MATTTTSTRTGTAELYRILARSSSALDTVAQARFAASNDTDVLVALAGRSDLDGGVAAAVAAVADARVRCAYLQRPEHGDDDLASFAAGETRSRVLNVIAAHPNVGARTCAALRTGSSVNALQTLLARVELPIDVQAANVAAVLANGAVAADRLRPMLLDASRMRATAELVDAVVELLDGDTDALGRLMHTDLVPLNRGRRVQVIDAIAAQMRNRSHGATAEQATRWMNTAIRLGLWRPGQRPEADYLRSIGFSVATTTDGTGTTNEPDPRHVLVDSAATTADVRHVLRSFQTAAAGSELAYELAKNPLLDPGTLEEYVGSLSDDIIASLAVTISANHELTDRLYATIAYNYCTYLDYADDPTVAALFDRLPHERLVTIGEHLADLSTSGMRAGASWATARGWRLMGAAKYPGIVEGILNRLDTTQVVSLIGMYDADHPNDTRLVDAVAGTLTRRLGADPAAWEIFAVTAAAGGPVGELAAVAAKI